MQKDEIWELKPGEEKSGQNGGASPESGSAEAADEKGEAGGADKAEKPAKKKDPGRIDMDEILELKPEETGGGEPPDDGKKEALELVDIGEKKLPEEPESVVPSRKEETSINIEKPQIIEPDEKKESAPVGELRVGKVKRYEQVPSHKKGGERLGKSGLLTLSLFVIFVFLAGSAALLALPFFGIETIPDELPVIGDIIGFYRNLPIFPD